MTDRFTRLGSTFRGLPRPSTSVHLRLGMAGLILALGCSDIGGINDGPTVQSARLVVAPPSGASQTYSVTAAGGVSPSPVRLRVGANQLTVTWLTEGGGETGLGQLRLVIDGLTGGVTYRALSATRATLTVPSTATVGIGELRADRPDGSTAFAADLDFAVDP